MTTIEEKVEYRLVYNWGQSATEVCEVWSIGEQAPHAYAPVPWVGTSDDDASLGEAEDPAERVRARLQAMLRACDKPVLRFPEDFTG